MKDINKIEQYLEINFPAIEERRIKHLWSNDDTHRFRINYFGDGKVTRSYFVIVDSEKELKHRIINN